MASNDPLRSMLSNDVLALAALAIGPQAINIECETSSRLGVRITSNGEPQKVKLPADFSKADRIALESWGVELLGQADGDRLFIDARIPAGWKSKPTDHYMYSHIYDEQDRPRIHVMYKAAAWDRAAWMRALPRFSADYSSDDWSDRSSGHFPAIVDGAGKVLWRGEVGKGDTSRMRASAATVLYRVCPEYSRLNDIDSKLKAITDGTAACLPGDNVTRSRMYAKTRHVQELIRAKRIQAYWDAADMSFGDSLSSPPTGEKYELYRIYFHRDGTRVDEGSAGTTTRTTAAEAIAHFREIVEKETSYDVRWHVKKDGKVIHDSWHRQERPCDVNQYLYNSYCRQYEY